MANEAVQIIGLKEANRALKRLPDFAKVEVQQEMDVTAFQVAQGAQARVRRRTGFLKTKVQWKSRPASVSAVVGVADTEPGPDGRTAFYWKFQEYGIHGSPFIRPAAESLAADHEKRVLRALNKASAQMEADAQP